MALGTTDFRAMLTMAKAASPDAVYFGGVVLVRGVELVSFIAGLANSWRSAQTMNDEAGHRARRLKSIFGFEQI